MKDHFYTNLIQDRHNVVQRKDIKKINFEIYRNIFFERSFLYKTILNIICQRAVSTRSIHQWVYTRMLSRECLA